MVKVVESILQDEFKRVKHLQKKYEEKISELPLGYLLERGLQGKKVYYLSYREGDRIRQKYLGKLSVEEIKQYQDQMKLKKQLRQQLKETKQNIRYLEKLLRK